MNQTSSVKENERRPGIGLHSLLKHKLFRDWFSGLVAGFTSTTLCAPLDVAKIRHMVIATTKSNGSLRYRGFLHTLKTIYEQEGFHGLYKGYSVTKYAIPIFHSLYFSIFHFTKNYFNTLWRPEEHVVSKNILSAIVTGFICDTVTNPFWVARTRIISQYLHKDPVIKYKGLVGTVLTVYREEGFRSLFKGLIGSYIGLSHAAILYPTYEYFKAKIQQRKGKLNSLDVFGVSLVSKFLAMVLTYPHMVMRTRLQDNRKSLKDGNSKVSIVETVKQTYHHEGFRGLYSGLRIDLVRVLPSNAITFVTFELMSKKLTRLANKEPVV